MLVEDVISLDSPALPGTAASLVAPQRTLRRPVSCNGVGLHSGIAVTMTLMPAAAGTGITFRRLDETCRDPLVPARWDRVVDTTHCSLIANDDGVSVRTVEHLMAALGALGVDNVEIVIDGPEVPAMDGSAAPFVFLVECAGLVEQAAPRRAIKVMRPIEVGEGRGHAALRPAAAGLTLETRISFDAAVVAEQALRLELTPWTFKAELGRARTFGFLEDVGQMRQRGLALGGSLDNAVIVTGEKVLNEGGLRYRDEFVRHKMLDAVGDLALAGAPLIGAYSSVRPGHRQTNALLRALFASTANWRWVDVEDSGEWLDEPEAARAG